MQGEREVGGLTCSAVLEQLSAYVDGELEAGPRAAIDAHLAGCDLCERFGGVFGAWIGRLRRVGPEPLPDPARARLTSFLDVRRDDS